MLVLPHFHVRERDLIPREHLTHAGIDALFQYETVGLRGLLEVREMRALDALLTHPDVTCIERELLAGGPRAEDNHAAALHDEPGHRECRPGRMFEDHVEC